MADETILITGGTGFIGAYTAAAALDEGHDVVVFDIDPDERILETLGVADAVEIFQGDITDTTSVVEAVTRSGAGRIVHLAALLTDTSSAHPRRAIDVNIKGTNTIFEVARIFDEQITRVAWASSSAVYAPPSRYADPEVDEDDLVYPETLYGAAKAYNEHQADLYRDTYDLSLVGIRPTLVYGPYRESGSASAYAQVIEGPARGRAVTVGPKDHVLDWQYVEDAAQAFLRAAFVDEDDLTRSVYNTCGERATLAEVAEVVSAYLGNTEITLTDEGDVPWNHYMEMDAAKADLGYDPEYSLEDGVQKYIEVVRDEMSRAPNR